MATLKDVAKETGLTVSTVSRVLNNRGYISQETREKVYDAMKNNYNLPTYRITCIEFIISAFFFD